MHFTDKLQTRYSDYDRYNRLYPESILKLFEAVAEHHMHSIGDSVVKGDVSWLITDWHLEVERYPEREEELSAATWIRRSEKPYTMDRQFVMTAGDEQVIRASLTFTLYDMQRKRLVRISDELLDAYAPEQEGVSMSSRRACMSRRSVCASCRSPSAAPILTSTTMYITPTISATRSKHCPMRPTETGSFHRSASYTMRPLRSTPGPLSA